MRQCKPEEITVKVSGNNQLTVEGKHEEKQDEHGKIYGQFFRRYILPNNFDINKVESSLSLDGLLNIMVF